LIKAIGIHTGKAYATGTNPEEVMRQLHEKYPTFETKENKRDRESLRTPILPEPVQIYKFR